MRAIPGLVTLRPADANEAKRAENRREFSGACRYVPEAFRDIYGYDAVTRREDMSAEERLAWMPRNCRDTLGRLATPAAA
jgi:hypothetical protein